MRVASPPANQVQSCAEPTYVIALSDRAVRGTLAIFNHYSVQYWLVPCDVALQTTTPTATFQKEKHAAKLASVEILREGGYNAKIRRGRAIATESVGVSVIYFSDSGEYVMPLWKTKDKEAADAKWKKIEDAAKAYAYGELQGFDGKFKHWPNSIYRIGNDVNNSNTFARQMLDAAGIARKEMSGWHPGRDAPSPETEKYETPVKAE